MPEEQEALYIRGKKTAPFRMRMNNGRSVFRSGRRRASAHGASFFNAALAELIETAVSRGAKFRLTVKGCSMTPFIKDKDIVTVSALHGGQFYGFGKSVAFFYPGRKMLGIHRIIGRRDSRYLTKGDNSRQADGLIPKENIIGYVTKVERNHKNVLLGLGPERFMIAFLNRIGLLYCFFRLARLARPLVGNWGQRPFSP